VQYSGRKWPRSLAGSSLYEYTKRNVCVRLDSVFWRGLGSPNVSDPNTSNLAVAVATVASHQGICWLALRLTTALGRSRIKKLIDHYGAAVRVFQSSFTELEATGMRALSAQPIVTGKSLALAQQEWAKAIEAGVRIIALFDPEYPSRLKEIYEPPMVLFVKGSVGVLAQPGIASRRHSSDAQFQAAMNLPSQKPHLYFRTKRQLRIKKDHEVAQARCIHAYRSAGGLLAFRNLCCSV